MKQLLNGVSLYLNEGDRIGIIGINGTGKSTLLRILAGVSGPDSGNISTKPNIQISYLPQNPDINPEMTVLEQVMSDMPAEYREVNEYEAKSMLNKQININLQKMVKRYIPIDHFYFLIFLSLFFTPNLFLKIL